MVLSLSLRISGDKNKVTRKKKKQLYLQQWQRGIQKASTEYFRNSRDHWDNGTTSPVSENLDSIPHFPKECRRQSKDLSLVLPISSVCQPFLLPADFDLEAKGLGAPG